MGAMVVVPGSSPLYVLSVLMHAEGEARKRRFYQL